MRHTPRPIANKTKEEGSGTTVGETISSGRSGGCESGEGLWGRADDDAAPDGVIVPELGPCARRSPFNASVAAATPADAGEGVVDAVASESCALTSAVIVVEVVVVVVVVKGGGEAALEPADEVAPDVSGSSSVSSVPASETVDASSEASEAEASARRSSRLCDSPVDSPSSTESTKSCSCRSLDEDEAELLRNASS